MVIPFPPQAPICSSVFSGKSLAAAEKDEKDGRVPPPGCFWKRVRNFLKTKELSFC